MINKPMAYCFGLGLVSVSKIRSFRRWAYLGCIFLFFLWNYFSIHICWKLSKMLGNSNP